VINEKRIREALRLEQTDTIFLLVKAQVSGVNHGFIYSVEGETVKSKGVLMRKGNELELTPKARDWVKDNLGKANYIGKDELTIKPQLSTTLNYR